MKHLSIDGTDKYGAYTCDSLVAPFAVFDETAQDWIITGLRFHWMARLVMWWYA